ncbi:hypothetical protein J7554_01650 [Wohlfahrtiimonas chitiniclastica]|uniref:DUF3592 domain-containing protein n=1 Tax=Wohlfahrtiimonas chitiniclastica TaxID=400946 RepID=A0AB35BW64_9GAMM|nr:hypothetical protein [Wohlfahrtiimonas chitiniclastica]MBS7823924.1 hypothetical protein [Wohlfahrtiimonas chitiniclastica]MBS7827830.1 hypothetical protein [Wohlfahrtiimonas chitiniclastica]MBS7839542.1 hypothetical protein [Wohlfahrtiimonas chitiniclastica]
MFNQAFIARLLRLVGAALVLSAGYFVYLDKELIYTDATIVRYEGNQPLIRFAPAPNEQITYQLPEAMAMDQHPVGSTLLVRYPSGDYGKLEYVSPVKQWAFYIVLPIGLILFFIGAYLTLKVRRAQFKQLNKK